MAATEVEKVCKATKQLRMKLDCLQGRNRRKRNWKIIKEMMKGERKKKKKERIKRTKSEERQNND